MAQGHLIPAVDTALLLATHGAVCTIVATPATAARGRPTVERFEVTRAQAPGFFRNPGWEKFADDVERARAEADGVVMNTFLEMEPEYVSGYADARGMKVWTVGPVALYHQSTATLAARGNAAAIGADECLQWLDGKEPGSVVYVSFGSIVHPEEKQIVELGLGLEASGQPFIWAGKSPDHHGEASLAFLRELEARTAGRGLIIRGQKF
uniref:UDP-glycosyltransferases domain-containing protein n=1 Tax=Oryza brachyantha TaxID=4533 RepID=J3LNX1_ORYBR